MNDDLDKMTPEEVKAEVIKLRTLIRYHKDQKADDRCWVDDLRLARRRYRWWGWVKAKSASRPALSHPMIPP